MIKRGVFMAVVNISIPEEILKKVDNYKKVINKNRSEFVAEAVKKYFEQIDHYIAFKKQKKSINNLMSLGEKLWREGVFDNVDAVRDIRKLRQERTDELLRKVQ